MEFWGVEVKNGEILPVMSCAGMILRLSQASLGKLKEEKGNESICLFATVDGKKLVLATLYTTKLPQQHLGMVFDRDFELSHDWENGSVYFYGYRINNPLREETKSDESESEEAIPYTVASDEVKPKDNNSLSTSIPLSSRNTDVERIILSEEHYALFEVNISELINNPSSYFNFRQRLFEVSGGKITEEGLQLMAASQRHQLCTTNTWNEDTPTIYSAIQVYIEGRIAGVPYVNDGLPDYYLESTYDANWRVNPFLVGANILNIYTLLGEAYDCIAVKLLSRYYNGDAAEDVLQVVPQLESHILNQLQRRHWKEMHYLGVIIEMDLVLFDRWVSYGFSMLSFPKNKDGTKACAMIKLLKDNIYFIKGKQSGHFYMEGERLLFNLSSTRFVDPCFALRILDNNAFTPLAGPVLSGWHNPLDCESEIVEVLNYIIRGCGREAALQYMPTIARLYFQRWLPISLSSNQKLALLYLGLQGYSFERFREIINISEEELDLSLQKILEEGYDYLLQKNLRRQEQFAEKHRSMLF
ncbi:uncharacterized protein LOC111397350 isoform X3 [Olea europaea var. sylvestris]|uniref:uncharacterized protein LOC111397350 isoform X3 n=1 Tax=Olea europaea var. sylvestris TaxID=158386 RepID=UPI000C1D4B0E|nr:uncharacterized protein LOC111397350 isoform X3 [Olea europaea var. sylvestris]